MYLYKNLVLDNITFLNRNPFEIKHALPLDSECQLLPKTESFHVYYQLRDYIVMIYWVRCCFLYYKLVYTL